jgi:hypothetical protein
MHSCIASDMPGAATADPAHLAAFVVKV